jgi:hypothetical protein
MADIEERRKVDNGPIVGSNSPPPDEVTLGGQGRSGHESLARRHGEPRFVLTAAGIIGALAAAVVLVLAVHAGKPAVLHPAGPIKVVNGNTLSFAVQGTAGAVVQVQYLQVDHGRETMWLSVVTRGLPRGFDYTAKAGKCVRGRPVTLATYSGLPDPHSGILLLAVNNLPVSTRQVTWLTLDNVRGQRLGGIRGLFLVRQAATRIAPGGAVCG